MTDINVSSTAFQVEKRSWCLETADVPGFTVSGKLDVSAFTAETHYPNGYIKSGEPLGRLSNGLYVPYSAGSVTNEVQTITVDATGGTFTITVEGEATAAIAYNATAAAVQAALELLAGINPGDIVVTGGVGAAGGGTPYTLTFGGKWEDLNAPAVTTGAGSLTGGAGTAAVATAQAGGSVATGAQTGAGLLYSSTKVPNTAVTTIDVGAAILVAFAPIRESRLPRAIDAGFRRDLRNLWFDAGILG